MAGKARVHELAKELKVTSKAILRWLNNDGQFVKSASSTVEAPVARRVRAHFHGTQVATEALQAGPSRQAPKTRQVGPTRIIRRQQSPSKGSTFGLGSAGGAAENSAFRTPRSSATIPRRPRQRDVGLPPLSGTTHLDAIAGLLAGNGASQIDREDVNAVRQCFDATGRQGYGYLAWRYATLHQNIYSDVEFTTPSDDLAAMARVVDAESQFLDRMLHTVGPFLENPILARRGLDNAFHELTDSDDIGSSEADARRRIHAIDLFLHCACVLTIASPDCDQTLWDMLGALKPPTPGQLVEPTPRLLAELEKLNDLIAAVSRLLSTDGPSLARLYGQSHSELVALRAGRYDFLLAFRDIAASTARSSRRTIGDLPFVVLPQGEHLRRFLDDMRTVGLSGHEVDPDRLKVLEDLENHFGPAMCDWYVGSESSASFNNEYMVLAIRSADIAGVNAVAISPIAGEHGTYVVRHERAEADWTNILARPKPGALAGGARRLHFIDGEDHTNRYAAMLGKIVALLECDVDNFMNPFVFDHNSRKYGLA